LLCLGMSCMTLATPDRALAYNKDAPPSLSVWTKDLNLTSLSDQKPLDHRIQSAAPRVCHALATATLLVSDNCVRQSIRLAKSSRNRLVDDQNTAKDGVGQGSHATPEPAQACVQDLEQKPGGYDVCSEASIRNGSGHAISEDETAPTDETMLNELKGC
jgi:UrcA family protein